MSNWMDEAKADAETTAREFLDEMVDQLIDDESVADQIHDYSESYHHENHVDKSYTLSEAAELLDDLDDYEETDEGLWEDLSPRDAISAQAAYTYGNAVNYLFGDLTKKINKDDDIEDLLRDYQNIEDKVKEDIANGILDLDDEDDEVEKRQEALKKKIKKRVEEIVERF